jgi:hypothetical protein
MAERIDLTTPFQPDPRQSSQFYIARLDLNWEQQHIGIHLADPVTGIRRSFGYEGETAQTMMTQLNKANLSTNSLHKRVIEQLINDGKLSGSVAGTPD